MGKSTEVSDDTETDDVQQSNESNNTTKTTNTNGQGSTGIQNADSYYTTDPLLNKDRFKNRRKMAWISMYNLVGAGIFIALFSIISLILFAIFPEKMSQLMDKYKIILDWTASLLTWLFSAHVAIIMGYMGFTTFAYGKFSQSQQNNGSNQ